jgi:hypothetical protein
LLLLINLLKDNSKGLKLIPYRKGLYMTTHSPHLLSQPAEQLPVSEEFIKMMQQLHFQTLGELVAHPVYQLLKMDGFGYRMLKELIYLLEAHGLSSHLKE